MRESLRKDPLNVVLLREMIKEAFEAVVDAAVKLKFVAKKAKTSFQDESVAIKVNLDDIEKYRISSLKLKLNK